MASRVRVVMPISGSSLELDMEPESTVADLKRAIAGSAWAVHPLCQRIIDQATSEELGDAVPLVQDAYVLIKSLEALRRELHFGDSDDARLEALSALCAMAAEGGFEVMSGAVACLDNGSARVRRAAAHALKLLAQSNDRWAVACEVAECFKHPDHFVRRLALEVFEEVIEPGDGRAVPEFVARLGDRDFEVQRSAISALGRLAQHGQQSAILEMLEAQIASGRRARPAALTAFGAVATPGDSEAIAVVAGTLPAACDDTTRAALRALAQLAGRGDRQASAGIAACLDHEDAGVKWVAVTALAEVAGQDDPEAVEALLGALEDEDSFVREAAVKAVARVLPADRRRDLPALAARLDDESAWVAKAAVHALQAGDEEGDQGTEATVTGLH